MSSQTHKSHLVWGRIYFPNAAAPIDLIPHVLPRCCWDSCMTGRVCVSSPWPQAGFGLASMRRTQQTSKTQLEKGIQATTRPPTPHTFSLLLSLPPPLSVFLSSLEIQLPCCEEAKQAHGRARFLFIKWTISISDNCSFYTLSSWSQ